MHVTSYDVLVGGLVLYPLRVNIDFWEETIYYHLGWQIGVNHKASLLVRFIGGQIENPTSQLCWLDFQAFHPGLELLEGNVHDQDAPLNGELAMSGP